MQLENALHMHNEVLHTRQCLGLTISLALFTFSLLECSLDQCNRVRLAMVEVCITSSNMCFKRAGNPTESDADVKSTIYFYLLSG